ncbi:MAG: nucleoside deaminase [Alistipes sp.]|jgi:tRNA(Arg) A34 adenosine deaminase TadA|nr:nucleoside deaminase [Alistipes sp.]MBQ5692727.1 nucleoside deaminase [Alistipes sp.]MBQ5855594.1 nucleoside deaminase [Alistipes sp.]
MTKSNFTAEDAKFMQQAIDLSIENVANGGGPFGAVIVRDGEVIATGTNRVTANCDPTAHAEVSAIRAACAKLGDFKLSGCTIYSSCEPCPMCLSALYWAGVERIFYGNTKQDAKEIDFDDSFIYDQIALDYSERSIPCINIMRDNALEGFKAWREKADKILY